MFETLTHAAPISLHLWWQSVCHRVAQLEWKHTEYSSYSGNDTATVKWYLSIHFDIETLESGDVEREQTPQMQSPELKGVE